MRSTRADLRGFTLIELLVVIAIIALLSAIVAPNAARAIEKAKVVQFVSDYKAVKAAMYSYYADTGRVPGAEQPLDQILLRDPGVAGWDGPYLDKIPRPPWNPLIWVGASWLRWRPAGASDVFFCYENGVTPPIPLRALVNIDQLLDGGDGPTLGSVRGRENGSFNSFCSWFLAWSN